MKKLISILIMVVFIFSLCSCGVNVNKITGLLTDDEQNISDDILTEDESKSSGISSFGKPSVSEEGASDVNVIGKWRAPNQVDADGNVVYMYLILQDDGYAAYWYNNPLKIENAIIAFYEGTWESAGKGSINLKLGLSGGTSANAPDVKEINGKFKVSNSINDESGNTLTVTHAKGTPLLAGLEKSWVEFSSYDSYTMNDYVTLPCDDVTEQEVYDFLMSGGVNGILRSRFDSPDTGDVNLFEVVYQMSDEDVDYDKLYELVEKEFPNYDSSMTYITEENLDKFLISVTGYGLNDCMWNFGDTMYSPELNAYYTLHGDTNHIFIKECKVAYYGGFIVATCKPEYVYDDSEFDVMLERNCMGDLRILSVTQSYDYPPEETEAPTMPPSSNDDRMLFTDYLSVKIPDSWKAENLRAAANTDQINEQWLEFDEEPDYSTVGGGWLCSIVQFKDNNPNDYHDIVHYEYLGELRCDDGKKFGVVAVYPSDVQPSEANRDIYFKMYDDIPKLTASIQGINGAAFYPGVGGVTEFIIPESDFTYLTEYDLQGLTKEELRIARNEIYARHGRRFTDAALQAHFDSCSWYNGTINPKDFDDKVLSDCEVHNISLIKKFENAAG